MNASALPPKERILGIRFDGAATAFVVKDIRGAGIVETEVGGVPVGLAAVGPDLRVVAFARRVEDRILTFTCTDGSEPTLKDNETHSRWQISDGRAVEGPLEGRRLERLVAHPAFWFGWYAFFPDSVVWRLSR